MEHFQEENVCYTLKKKGNQWVEGPFIFQTQQSGRCSKNIIKYCFCLKRQNHAIVIVAKLGILIHPQKNTSQKKQITHVKMLNLTHHHAVACRFSIIAYVGESLVNQPITLKNHSPLVGGFNTWNIATREGKPLGEMFNRLTPPKGVYKTAIWSICVRPLCQVHT